MRNQPYAKSGLHSQPLRRRLRPRPAEHHSPFIVVDQEDTMAPRKKATRAKAAKKPAPKARKLVPAKTKALAVPDAIVREELPARVGNHHDLLHAMLSWSPMNVLVTQQAAFWEGFMGSAQAERADSRKRVRAR
jgi:hypothetical protein